MYVHVVEHVPQTQRSKAQSALHKAAKQVRADQSAITQASRQSWQELACRRALILLAAFSKRTKKSNLPGKNHTTTHKAAADSPLFPISIKCNTVFSLRHFYAFRTCMRRPGCFLEHGALGFLHVVSLHLKPWTSVSASFTFCSIFSSLGARVAEVI